MPLSEREQRLLAQMEAALSAEDPKLVSTFSGKVHRPRPIAAIALVVVGIVLLFTGLIAQLPPVGILGFLTALTGTYLGINALRRTTPAGLLHRIEERWQERDQ